MLHVCVVLTCLSSFFCTLLSLSKGTLPYVEACYTGGKKLAGNHGIIASGGAQGRDQEKEGFGASWDCTVYTAVWPRNSPALCITSD
jgi:hypothetical protein